MTAEIQEPKTTDQTQQTPVGDPGQAQQPQSQQPQPADQPNPEAAAVEKATAAIRGVLDRKPKSQDPAPQDDKDSAELESVVKTNPKAWRILEAKKKQWAEREQTWSKRESELQAKLKELESKPRPTELDESKMRVLEQQLDELKNKSKSYQERLAELDYRQSDEFKEKYVLPWQNMYKRALDYVKQLGVMNELGEVERTATQEDFEAIRTLHPSLRRAKAKELFGDDAADVISYVRQLEEKKAEAEEAVQSRASNIEKINLEKRQKEEAEIRSFSQITSTVTSALEKEFPDLFSRDHYKDQPEMRQLLDEGYAYVDDLAANKDKMNREEVAQMTAVVRARAAAFPILWTMLDNAKKELEKHTGKLEKIRSSDPGDGKIIVDGGGSPAPVEVGGIDDMASKFNE